MRDKSALSCDKGTGHDSICRDLISGVKGLFEIHAGCCADAGLFLHARGVAECSVYKGAKKRLGEREWSWEIVRWKDCVLGVLIR